MMRFLLETATTATTVATAAATALSYAALEYEMAVEMLLSSACALAGPSFLYECVVEQAQE